MPGCTSCCCSFEDAFNWMGYFPPISSVSGVIRILIGVVEIVVSAIFALFCCQADELKSIVDGMGHVVRGTIETIPILGNLVLIIYDHVF